MNEIDIRLVCESNTKYSNLINKGDEFICPECFCHNVNIKATFEMPVNKERILQKEIELHFDRLEPYELDQVIEKHFDEIIFQIDIHSERLIQKINEYQIELIEKVKLKRKEILSEIDKFKIKSQSKKLFFDKLEKTKKLFEKIKIEETIKQKLLDSESIQIEIKNKIKQYKFLHADKTDEIEEFVGILSMPGNFEINYQKDEDLMNFETERYNSQTNSSYTSKVRVDKKSYTQNEVDRKAYNLLNELVNNINFDESIKDFEEFNPNDQVQYVDFIEKLIMLTLEMNESTRALLGQFFYYALKDKKLETCHLEQGLKRVTEISEDISIDIPKISSCLSQIIVPLFNENLSVEFLRNALEPIKENKLCADTISETLNRASDLLGHSIISDIFRASNLKLYEFLEGIDDPTEYINKHKLQWVTGRYSSKRTC